MRPRCRCRWMARQTEKSAFSISRLRLATRGSTAATRCLMCVSACRAPKPASFRLPSAAQPLTFPVCPADPAVAGGLPTTSITGFSGFGRQSTNPQFQNPALLDPKINFTYVKGKHSLKFGYEYEKIWMGVSDNNPLYGSFTYGGGYSNAGGSTVSDTYWADFLFGTLQAFTRQQTSLKCIFARPFTVSYAQDDYKFLPNSDS